jgi:hypothetical protein
MRLLDRVQAMALLKELTVNNLIEPSYISINERKPNDYQIQIKCGYKKLEVDAYAKKQCLTIEEDKERKYLLIFKT